MIASRFLTAVAVLLLPPTKTLRDSQQRIFPIGFLFLKLPPPPRAALLVLSVEAWLIPICFEIGGVAYHVGSMGLVYLATFTIKRSTIHVGRYTIHGSYWYMIYVYSLLLADLLPIAMRVHKFLQGNL